MIAEVQLALRLGQVEGGPVTFGKGADQEDEEAQRLQQYIIVTHLLLRDDGLQAQAARQHEQGDDRNAHSEFVADDLRCAAYRRQQREFIVRCPSPDHDAIDAHAHYAKNIEDADIDVGDL